MSAMTRSATVTGEKPPRALLVFLGLCLLFQSALGAFQQVSSLERVEDEQRRVRLPAAVWSPDLDRGMHVVDLGMWPVPAEGVLRVTVCTPRPRAPITLVVRSPEGRALLRRALSAELSAERDCLTQEWSTRDRAVAVASLETRGGARPLAQLVVRSGARITPWRLWPLAALLAGLALCLLAPWISRPTPGDVVAVPHPSPARSPYGLWLTFGAFVLVFAATFSITRHIGGAQGMLTGLLVQNGLLVLCSAGLLGGLDGGRAALGLRPPPAVWMLRAAAAAGLLLLVALATTTMLRDVGDAPIHHEIERMPNRYALMFGAVLAPFAEELYYRELLRTSLGWYHPAIGLWGQAVIFALVHVQQLGSALIALVPIALVGAVNGVLRERSGSLLPSWLVHTIYNGMLVASLASSGP